MPVWGDEIINVKLLRGAYMREEGRMKGLAVPIAACCHKMCPWDKCDSWADKDSLHLIGWLI